jgi:hypothetical protein
VDAVFPNFLLSDLITKHRQDLQNRKQEAVSSKQQLQQPHSTASSGRLNEIHELLEQKSDQLAIADLNYLIHTLSKKKRTLEQVSHYFPFSFMPHY